jgi:hypothetical protein
MISAFSIETLKEFKETIFKFFNKILSNKKPEIRESGLESIQNYIIKTKSLSKSELDSISKILKKSINDYSIDQRGDIGILIRMKTIEVI